ncbi:hypothetical protein JKA74_11750 [Marivirga sp. S37H4]|uniref:Tetratricopeptide repeat protein n=1 Tax=Marivirga aurantiaca TaxID=2802615 RepID=A0A934WZF4_9BACT|nr:DUF6340 family protein [Marivirga aurantiaca]MBK6265712.1 hypothetical protein [Marivirga aurantiaca]
MKLRFLLFTTFALLMTACMKSVSISTMRPAEINVPNNIQSIVMVDRTKYEKETIGIIEGILTGEGINEDKDGVMAVFTALQNNLRNSPRFEVKLASERLSGNTILGSFPDPIDWREVNRLTNKYNVDALLAVELFDTNFIVTNGKRKNTRKVKDKDGNEVEEEYTEYYAEGIGTARIGFRLYYPKEQSIIDQDIYSQNRTWEATGTSIKDALAGLMQKSQATKLLGSAVGGTYASKIAPTPVYLSRSYYAKPKKNAYISKGARQAEVGQWEEAINTWKMGLNRSDDTKVMGRMAYNIALGYEVMGNLREAHEWAGRSYIDYGEKKGQSYASSLSNRMFDEEILNEQMSLPEPEKKQPTTDKPVKEKEKKIIQLKIE